MSGEGWYFRPVSDGPEAVAEAALPAVDRFRDATGSVFRLHADGCPPVELTLAEVEEGTPAAGWEAFSLILHGTDPALSQGTYAVGHDRLGAFALFLVPIAGDGVGQLYQAVVNRPAP